MGTSSRVFRLLQVDAFTTRPFAGNPAGVVLDADGLSDAEMLAVARELNNSDTAFLLRSTAAGADLRIRYFTPKVEVPVCGHATVASLFVRAEKAGPGTVRFETGIGVLDATVTQENGAALVRFRQAKPTFEPPLDPVLATEVLAALGVPEGERRSEIPVQIVSTGHGKVIVPLRSAAVLHSLHPDAERLVRLSARVGCNGFYPFVVSTTDPFVTEGRMFAPAIGITEDPVTGNAAGPLGAYLVRQRVAPPGPAFHFAARQGTALGRPGSVEVRVRVEGGEPVEVTIGGAAVVVFRTEIAIPPGSV